MKTVTIQTPYITLGQFLQFTDTIQSGGMAKWFLAEYLVLVNGEEEDRRGRKLYPGDRVTLSEEEQYTIQAKN